MRTKPRLKGYPSLYNVPIQFAGKISRQAPEADLLLCFLRFVEDNAASLGIAFEETEKLDAIGQAYGTAFFPIPQLVPHVVKVAQKLGMDAAAFTDYTNAIAPDSFKHAFSEFGFSSGELCLEHSEEAGDYLFNFIMDTGTVERRSPGFASDEAFELTACVLERLCSNQQPLPEAASATQQAHSNERTLRVAFYACKDARLECLSFRHLRSSRPKMCACSNDGITVAIISMLLLFLGYRDGYDLVRKGHIDSHGFDAVVLEYSPERKTTSLRDVDEGIRTVSQGKTGIIFGKPDVFLRPDESALVRKHLVENPNVASHCDLFGDYGDSRSLTILQQEPSNRKDLFLMRITGGDWQKNAPEEFSDGYFPWLAEVIANQRDVPTLSAHINRERIAAQDDASLNLADYMDDGGQGTSLAVSSESLISLAEQYKQAITDLREADDAFATALGRLAKTETAS